MGDIGGSCLMIAEQIMLPGNALYIIAFVIWNIYHVIKNTAFEDKTTIEVLFFTWFLGWIFMNLILFLTFKSLQSWGVV